MLIFMVSLEVLLLARWRILLNQLKRFGCTDGFQSIDRRCADDVLPDFGGHELFGQRNRSVLFEANIGAERSAAYDETLIATCYFTKTNHHVSGGSSTEWQPT